MSAKRFQITKEIYLNATEMGSKITCKKITPKASDPGTFKTKRYVGQNNNLNSKDANASNNNSINTTIMKNKTNSNSHFINGNESTLPLSGQYDNSSKESDGKSAEKQKSEKVPVKNSILPVQEVQEKEANGYSAGITLAINRKDDEIKELRTSNQSIKAELSKMISCINKERRLIAEMTERNKSTIRQEKKLARASESLQMIKSFQIQLSDEPLNPNNEPLKDELATGRQSPYLGKRLSLTKVLKKPMKMEINLPNPNQTPEPNEVAPGRNQFNFPRSSVSSVRGFTFKENNHFSSSRNTPRINIAERSSSSNILLRKLSDQGSEYYTNLIPDSSRSHFESRPLRSGVRNPKQRSFKVSRVASSKRSLEGSISMGAESSLQPDDTELTHHKIPNSHVGFSKKNASENIAQLLIGLKDRLSKVLERYDMNEKRELARNKQLKNILTDKLSTQRANK